MFHRIFIALIAAGTLGGDAFGQMYPEPPGTEPNGGDVQPTPPLPGGDNGQNWRLGVMLYGNGGNSGCTVTSVFPNSPAQSIGLRNGDVIITVNSQFARDPLATRQMVMTSPVNAKIIFQRGRQFFEADVTFDDQIGQGGGQIAVAAAAVRTVKSVKVREVPQPRGYVQKSNGGGRPTTSRR